MSFKQEKRSVQPRFIDNRGDPDSLLYGCMTLDDRDRFEGYGVSAEREEVSDWTVLVDDYDSYQQLRTQEEVLSEAEDALREAESQIDDIEDELQLLRQEAVEMLHEYGSIAPEVLSRSRYLNSRLEQLDKWADYNRNRLTAARDNIQNLEAGERNDPDNRPSDEGGYNTIHWNEVYRWGRDLIDKLGWKTSSMGNGDLVTLIKQLKAKRRRRELTFPHFIHLLGLLNAELYKRTGARTFKRERDRMADLWKQHRLADRKNTDPYFCDDEVLFDPTARQYGETAISETELVKAIDLRAAANKLSTRHNLTFDEAVITLRSGTAPA